MENRRKVKPEIALIVAIVAGVVFGLLIKRFKIGLLLGVFIAMLYVLIASAKKKK